MTADTALRLSQWLGTSAELWLNLQKLYELRLAERETGEEIRRTVHQFSDGGQATVESPAKRYSCHQESGGGRVKGQPGATRKPQRKRAQRVRTGEDCEDWGEAEPLTLNQAANVPVVGCWVTVRIRAKMSNSGSDYQQAANFPNKIMVFRTLTKKTILLPLQ